MLERIINSTISSKNVWHAKNRRYWTACADVAHIHHSTSTPVFSQIARILCIEFQFSVDLIPWKKMGKIWNATHDPAWWTIQVIFLHSYYLFDLICDRNNKMGWAKLNCRGNRSDF